MRHSRTLLLVLAGLCAWGVAAIFTLPSGIYPNVAFPRIAVVAERGEDSPENIMVAVTRPFEQEVNAVQGLTRVRSKTIRGATEIQLDFAPSTDMREALSQTRARLSALASSLDPPVTLTIEQQTPSVFPVISFNVNLDTSETASTIKDGADLLDWASLNLRPRLSRLPDVFLVSVQGDEQRQVLVEADPARLASAGLTLDDLAKALSDSNKVDAVGVIEKDYKQFQILASSQIQDPEQLENLALVSRRGATMHLSDVARVKLGLADRTSVITGNGKDSVVVSLFMRYGGKLTALSTNLKAALAEISPTLPKGVHFTPVYDQAELVNDSIGGVRDAILIGILLTIIVLWLFLASWRLTIVAAVSIPISLLITFAVLTLTGQSLNLMSLGGIAVAIGLIIDDAIVVVENISRRVGNSDGKKNNRRRVIIDATNEIFGAVVGSSLTTVVVFLPLVLLEGIVGQFFIALAVGLSVGILVSMAVSLTLAPLMAAGPLGPHSHEQSTRRWMNWLAGFYERVARVVLRVPLLSAVAIIAILSVGAFFAVEQETGFLPDMDEGSFVLDYLMPVGTSLGETDHAVRKIEAILAEIPEISSYSRRTGAELGFFATPQWTGDFLVGLKSHAERERSIFEVMDDARERISREVPQIEVEFIQAMQDTLNDLAGNPSALEVEVFGNDYKVLQSIADDLTDGMEKIPGIVDVTNGETFGNPEMTYHIDVDAARRAGLSPTDVDNQLETALLGRDVTRIRQGERLIPVHLRYPDIIRRDPTWLSEMPLAAESGRSIPASLIAKLGEHAAVNELLRENQQPYVAVTAGIHDIDLGHAAQAVRALIAKTETPSDVRIELGGQVKSKERADRNMLTVLGLACALVFLLLVIQFRSYRLPFIIFLTLPPSQIGALLALRLTGTPLNISSEMGLVMLVGLVVKNGIIFIEYVAQLRESGVPTLRDALLEAGRVRLRPILMTTLAAIIAMVPLACNFGAGAELQKPLAIAVIGGLTVSTFFTVFIIPVAHLLLGESKSARIEEELQ